MKVYTPEIAFHNTQPVLSLDICKIENYSYKVVTSGADRHLVVWKIVLNPDINAKKIISVEPLADLNRHQKAINVVRFSPSKRMFASGDDEGYIFLWKLGENIDSNVEDGERNNFFDDSDFVNIETWTQFKVLRGHGEDVVDLCWSPSGQYLLSGSVDNEAILWDIEKGTRICYLAGHKGYIHGVAWDPLDEYLVTLSTDRVLRVFNVKNKRVVAKAYKSTVKVNGEDKVSRLFFDDTLQTYSRRICFTPGGELLLAPSGIVEVVNDDSNFKFINASHVFSRKNLSRPMCYLPTGKMYTIAIKCCPQLYQLDPVLDNQFPFPYRIIFAVATNESVLFYDTQHSAPFAMVSGIHYTRHTDLAWSEDGRILMISSTDGYCTFVMFANGELGTPYTGDFYKYEEPKRVENTPPKPMPPTESIVVENHKKTPEIAKITQFFQKLDKSSHKLPKSPLFPEKIEPSSDIVSSPHLPNEPHVVNLTTSPLKSSTIEPQVSPVISNPRPLLCVRSVKRKEIVSVGITLESPRKRLKEGINTECSEMQHE